VKSGTDFRSFGKITLTFDEFGELSVAVEKINIVSTIEEDGYMKDIISKYTGNFTVFKLLNLYFVCNYILAQLNIPTSYI